MRTLLFIFLVFISIFICKNSSYNKLEKFSKIIVDPPFIGTGNLWIDSIMNKMTIDEKIAQCFMVDVYCDTDKNNVAEVENIIKKYNVGGIILFKSTPSKIVNVVNKLQSVSKIPLLVSIDAEWGLSMRIDSTLKYPYSLMLGACSDNLLIYKMGKEIGEQLKLLGIHINFAPVADVNINPQNPVISFRSFGENADLVAEKGVLLYEGASRCWHYCCSETFSGTR